ncbi:MAG: class I SAM-dependent methyltransferase [Bacteroidales bacterium]|nr:class I SAM-dependent methyltransferase [Bacteroidales bacterium]
MELKQYTYMFEVEDNHWWYVGNHENFLKILQRHNLLRDGVSVLDAGCGTGKWLEILKKTNNISETGIDFQEEALRYARTRGDMNLQQGDVNLNLFPPSSFNLITSFDVICNREIDDNLVIKNFNSYLCKNGHLLLTVPAFQFLHSTHDEVVHTGKRYTRKQLRELLEKNDFEIIKISYVVCLLFPIALIKRIIDKIFLPEKKDHNEVKMPPNFVNKLFLSFMRLENIFLKHISLPFGLSVMVLAKKKEN